MGGTTATWCMQEAAVWGMASRIAEGVEGEGDGATVVREAVVLAREIAGKSQSVVGPGGPQGRGQPCCMVTGLLQKRKLAKKKKKEKDKTYQKKNSPIPVLGV